jgi:DnaK suppressor protein
VDKNDDLTHFTPYKIKKNEAYMCEPQLAHFEKLLAEWKHSLMEEVDKTVSVMKDEVANYPDPSDRATQEENFRLLLRERDRERRLIKKINESLEQIKTGDYGYCESCGVEIGIRRLEARPTASLCIDCKTLAELKEKQIYS